MIGLWLLVLVSGLRDGRMEDLLKSKNGSLDESNNRSRNGRSDRRMDELMLMIGLWLLILDSGLRDGRMEGWMKEIWM
jgi:hypothetical protein